MMYCKYCGRRLEECICDEIYDEWVASQLEEMLESDEDD